MIRKLFFLVVIFVINLLIHQVFGQLIKVKGKLINSEDNSSVYGGVITLERNSFISNQEGEFEFNCIPGKKILSARALGFKPLEIQCNIYSDTTLNIILEVLPVKIKEVTILADSMKNIERSRHGNILISRASLNESPRYFSEPDLIKSLQGLPGVLPGKDGSTDIFVRGGSPGQNVFLVNGCYFFIPSHILGLSSSFDLDFIDKTELVKDYFPPDLGGGASSIIKIDYQIPKKDSLGIKLRFGLLSSGLTFEIPFKRIKLGITGGIKRGNYSIYAPLLKTLINNDISDFLPPNNYAFSDSYLRVVHSSPRLGTISYVFMNNLDKGGKTDLSEARNFDTLFKSGNGFNSLWKNSVHSINWILPSKGKTKWIYDININQISIRKENFISFDKYYPENNIVYSKLNSIQFSPAVFNIGSKIYFTRNGDVLDFSGGIYNRFRKFNPNILVEDILNSEKTENKFLPGYTINEPAVFISGGVNISKKWFVEGGMRASFGVMDEKSFLVFEPRLRLSHETSDNFSQHINYVRISQFDHSLESSNVGLRSLLWIPVMKEYGPEISDIYSFGFNGQVKKYLWSCDLYYKNMHDMVDFKPGASFLYATSLNELLESINGKAYGLELFIVKRTGKLNGNLTYTFSRSKREWYTSETLFWIPSAADRPHNINIALKYYWKNRVSFGFNWVYSSGLPATIYTNRTSLGKWFETKNNIRYPDYHRLDFSIRKIVKIKKTFINLDFDVANVYNRKNTYYIKEEYDDIKRVTRYKNVSLFPIMPTISISLQQFWKMN